MKHTSSWMASRPMTELDVTAADVSEPVRRVLVKTLYRQPAALAVASLCGLLSASFAAFASGQALLLLGSLVMGVIIVGRMATITRAAVNDESVSARILERNFLVGAYSYALTLGIVTALSLALKIAGPLQLLMIVNGLGYAIGTCARNAARPRIAIGQLGLALLPVSCAALYLGTGAHLLLALTVALVFLIMTSLTLNLFSVLRDSATAAQTSADHAGQMQRLAMTDSVTGLSNRAGLDHALTEALAEQVDDRTFALLWIDLDRFKQVNDQHGHPTGDRVLAEIAQRLRDAVPLSAAVSRCGGDEFIIFTQIDSREHGEDLARVLIDQVALPLLIDRDLLEVQASIGIAFLPDDADDGETLIRRADLALYHAKVNGRGRYCCYSPVMSREQVQRREIERDLRAAIGRDELSVFFQPILDLETGRIRAFEALVRWFHPKKGELLPGEFIPIAEETGLIVTLGNWITAQAAKACASWPDDIKLSVNLSPMQIRAPGAALGIMAALREAGLAPSRLELEVTESLFVQDNPATTHFITELSAAGVHFALDDFGTGSSSLSLIHSYPFNTIKVDRSFVSGALVGQKSDAIIRALAELGANLQIEIVAEGLETREQVENVRRAGCTLGQGFYFSRAVPDYHAAILLTQERQGGEDAKLAV